MRPYGGLMSGSPCTLRPPPPSPPPPPPAAAAPAAGGAAIGAPASLSVGAPRPPPAAGAGAAAAGLGTGAFGLRAVPCTKSKSDRAGSGLTSPSGVGTRVREDVEHLRFRIERAALPVGAAGRVRQHQRRQRTLPLAHDRRREDRPELVARGELHGFGLQLRREVDQIVERHALTFERRRLGHERLRRRIPLAGHVAFFDRPLFDRPHRLPGRRDRRRRSTPAWSAARSP